MATEISVVMMFRPAAFGNAFVGGPSLGFTPPEVPKGDHPLLPHFIFDPGWPIARYMNPGAVVFELDITESGRIDWIRIVRDVSALADFCKGRCNAVGLRTSGRKRQPRELKNDRCNLLSASGSPPLGEIAEATEAPP